MTTKPRAKKFRITRSSRRRQADGDAGAVDANAAQASPSASAQPDVSDGLHKLNPLEEMALGPTEDGLPDLQKKQEPGAEDGDEYAAIEAIRKEGLSGRQLRMARRVAQKHGITVESDYDAVLKLRQAGIDPFKRSNMLELVSADGGAGKASPNLPQPSTMATMPANHVYSEADRARTVMEIQRDIVRRRRRNLFLLLLRLSFFVFLPTILAGIYYYNYATPMYATKTEFLIQKADGGGSSGLGSLLAGSGLSASQDSITVQSYLTSREAMQRLDEDLNYKSYFQNDEIDPLQRLEADATNETAYKLYKKNVKIGFDPTEGIIKMEVVAPSPQLSAEFSKALLSYAEERVDNLTQRLREDQMKGSNSSYLKAEQDMMAAQAEVQRLQEEMGVFDASSDAAALMGQISGFEGQLQEKRLALQQLLDNARPNKARVDGLRGDIGRLETLIVELRAKLTETGGENGSLASVSGRLRIAQTNLETRTVLMQQSLQQLEVARIEANKQTRYLELGVRPIAPDEPTYPRAFENTLLSFLVFAGLYLMLSITASVLREQVSG